MEDYFILELREDRFSPNKVHTLLARVFRWINHKNKMFDLSFKAGYINEYFSINDQFKNAGAPGERCSSQNLLRSGMINTEQAINLFHLLLQVELLNISGDVVELGCYEGTTAILLQKTLDSVGSRKRLHVFDSFQGLPSKGTKDGPIGAMGQFSINPDALRANFIRHNTVLPEIHVGWFKDTLPSGLPGKISFAHIDGDLYQSTIEGLTSVYPRLSRGGIVVIDDYCDPTKLEVNNIMPGVKRACDEFLDGKPETMKVLLAGCHCHGYFRKQ